MAVLKAFTCMKIELVFGLSQLLGTLAEEYNPLRSFSS
jgi:hypothetical protein